MKKIQDKIRKFCKDNNMEQPVEIRMLDTVSELGEVAKEILNMNDYGNKPAEYKEEFKTEMGDLLFAFVTMANSMDIDLSEALDEVLEKYERRLKKGSASSEND